MIEEPLNVVVAMDLSDALIDSLREISPRLRIERHFPKVPDRVWGEVDILYTFNRLPTEPAQAPRLRWIQLHTAGIDHLSTHPIFQASDITLTSMSGVHAPQMAEWALAVMLMFNYRLLHVRAAQERGEWGSRTADGTRELYVPTELRLQTVGIVGYGSIGREIARLAAGLGMRVLASKRNLKTLREDENAFVDPETGDPEAAIPDRLYPGEAVASMARECDYLVVTTPLTPHTRRSIGADVFAAMKPTAILINIGRGEVVDEAALVAALQNYQIGGAALDVFEVEPLPAASPLWKMANVLVSPHISGNSARYHERAAGVFRENLTRFLEDRPLLNIVQRDFGY